MAASKTGIRRIAVGVDGSESSAAALKWAIRLARGMGSQAAGDGGVCDGLT